MNESEKVFKIIIFIIVNIWNNRFRKCLFNNFIYKWFKKWVRVNMMWV